MFSVRIAHNNVTAKLFDASPQVTAMVSEMLSYEIDGGDRDRPFGSGSWHGRSTFFSYENNTFPAGFLHLVVKGLRNRSIESSLIRKPLPAPLGPALPVVDAFGYGDSRYQYQPDTVERLARHGKMIARIATGGGKSRIAQIATARIMRKTLFLTTRNVLMRQMEGHFGDMMPHLRSAHPGLIKKGWTRVGVIGESKVNPSPWINVGMVQTIASHLRGPLDGMSAKKKAEARKRYREMRDLLASFEFVILEEAHESAGESYYQIMSLCKNAAYRMSLTATPFMKQDQAANMRLMACSGPIGVNVSEKQLIDSGILARPVFKYMRCERPTTLGTNIKWPTCYTTGVVDNKIRNEAIAREAIRASKLGVSVLILVQRQAHGKLLDRMINQGGAKSSFIFGHTEQKLRGQKLAELASGKINALIGSNILDVGVDVPAIGMVIIAGAGKDEVQLRQRIGRGLRAKKSGPNVALVVDFEDFGNVTLRKHARLRRRIVEGTPGFAENILPQNTDFDFVNLGILQSK